ncbi:hypothetical protein DPMN_019512 [Dreissena polymorpha]|uniref:Uncharacterized protein n=1 Tax=Dreissena polymorpha TaxID=45954 RepID=A0A9D4S9C7_DREPO|nr:hypothetical protein DPMN_019512 [Dreissena polymorpha]
MAGQSVDNLNSLRLRLFTEKAINNRKTVEIHTLPPTSASANFHCLRTRLQIGDWIESRNKIHVAGDESWIMGSLFQSGQTCRPHHRNSWQSLDASAKGTVTVSGDRAENMDLSAP